MKESDVNEETYTTCSVLYYNVLKNRFTVKDKEIKLVYDGMKEATEPTTLCGKLYTTAPNAINEVELIVELNNVLWFDCICSVDKIDDAKTYLSQYSRFIRNSGYLNSTMLKMIALTHLVNDNTRDKGASIEEQANKLVTEIINERYNAILERSKNMEPFTNEEVLPIIPKNIKKEDYDDIRH